MNELTLGIDSSLKCTGWAVINHHGELVASGTIKPDPKDELFERITFIVDLTVTQWLKCMGERPTNVAIEEGISHRNGKTTRNLAALWGAICHEFVSRGIPVEQVNVTEAKRTATGKGNATKAEMVAAATARWGITQPDEADAAWVAETARLLLLQHEADGKFD